MGGVALLNRDDAQNRIQILLSEAKKLMDEVCALSNEHKIEFSFMGSTMHFNTYYGSQRGDPPGKVGILVSDQEWISSNFTCSGEYESWLTQAFPQEEDEE